MITDLVVWTSVALAAAFVVAWACSPRLRAWIERPSQVFLDAVRRYDRDTRGEREQTRP
ncbi:MAG: hypothetical protein AB7U83_10695 [Vicinamibacterales bacterium]